jgi:hypothetical protein
MVRDFLVLQNLYPYVRGKGHQIYENALDDHIINAY